MKARIDVIADSLRKSMPKAACRSFATGLGTPFTRGLADYLKVFDDPYEAVEREVAAVKAKPFVPATVVVHGLVYDLASARLDTVVDGYAQQRTQRAGSG